MSEKNQVAKIIASQIGNKALYMIGAKQLTAGENFLSFKIGRNSKAVNYVKIELTPLDVYKMTFGRIRNLELKVVATEEMVYCDQLNTMIEKNTGLYTHL